MHHIEVEKYAREVAQEAWEEGNCEINNATEHMEQTIDGCHLVIYYSSAWELVSTMRGTDYYDVAHSYLVDLEGDRIGKDETIDHVITRLAYCILVVIAREELFRLSQLRAQNKRRG